MNTLLKDLLCKIGPGIGVVALAAYPTFAQLAQTKPTSTRANIAASRADIVAPTAEGRAPQVTYNLRNPHPLTTKQHAIVDPKTGKPAACGTMVTLPNGKSIDVCLFWKEIGALEAELNRIGWSFDQGAGMLSGPLQGTRKMAVSQFPLPLSKFQQQARVLASAVMPNVPAPEPNIAQAIRRQQSIVPVSPALLGTVGGTLHPLTLKEVKNYDFSFGDPTIISVFLNGKLELDGTSTSTSFDAEANAGGSLFGNSFDVLQTSGKLSAPGKGQLNINVTASVLGKSVYDVNQNAPSTFSKFDSVSKTLDESTTIRFTLLGIPISAKVGIQGKAGVSYGVTVAPVKASGNVVPTINTNAYAQIGADIDIASAGVGGRLTILNLTGDFNGDVAIVPDPKNTLIYSYDAQYCQTLDTLDGSLFAFLSTPFGEIDHTIFSFGGIKSSGCLFKESKTSPVFAQSQTIPARR